MMMRKCVSSHHQCKPISGRLGPIYLLFNIGKPISGLDILLDPQGAVIFQDDFSKSAIAGTIRFSKSVFYNNFAFSKVFYIFASRKILIWN
jgi:hypothetical protein